jgi:steroid 5-alpha reductase family enzyme
VSTPNESPRFRITTAVTCVGLITIVHVALVFLLYGQRVRFSFLPSEVVWLLSPAMAAFAGYYVVLQRRRSVNMPSWVAAFLLTLLSLSLSLYLSFNTYGT